MLNERQQKFELWSEKVLAQLNAKSAWKVTPIAGDASLRRYFRAEPATGDSTKPLILMDSPVADGSLANFVDIDQRLIKASVRAPQIYAVDQAQGFMLIEDFGDDLLKQELVKNRIDALFTEDILPTLKKLTNCSNDDLPNFDSTKIQQELDLFSDWYCDQHLKSPLNQTASEQWESLCTKLISTLEEIPKTFIHLDFHSCNLLRIDKNNIGVIDFQDARSGPISYDLTSWLWDRYAAWPRTDIERWIEEARVVLAPSTPAQIWLRWCDFTGLQRNLKIVGIFARLHYRDKKQGYLDLVPHFAAYCLDVAKRYPELASYMPVLQNKLDG